jgi:hypothetical protein
MSCQILFERMGFDCESKADGLFYVSTPLSFADGEPIGLYVRDRGSSVVVSDNANTLFHLMSVGMDLSDRKKWKGVRQIASSFGISLTDGGELLGDATSNRLHELISRYLATMLAISDMEKQQLSLSIEMSQFLEEVEVRLRQWRPDAEINHSPVISGHSGKSHRFDFRFGMDLVDGARPHSVRTGSILRKAADIQNTSTPYSILVVMDDREDPIRAAAEIDILSTLVKVLPFSRLAGNLSGGLITPSLN